MPRLTSQGKYDAEVVDARLTEAQTGTIGIQFFFQCPEGTIDHVMWVTPKTADRAWETLDMLGFTKKHAEDMDNLDRIGEIIKGARCQLVCEDEEYNGEVRLKVKWINRLGGRATGNTKASMHQMLMGNSITRLATPEPRSAPATAPKGPDYVDDRDIPF